MQGLSVLYIVGGTNAVGIRNNNWQSIIISMECKFWEIRYLMDVLLRSRQRRSGGVDSMRLIANRNLVLNYSEENIYKSLNLYIRKCALILQQFIELYLCCGKPEKYMQVCVYK